MRFSIITVCRNNIATIEQTLSSVTQQNGVSVDHIVIDGGSTDGTADFIDSKSGRLAHFISEPDDGIYDAMNKGLNIAKGDVVGFLNADDHYPNPDILASVARCFAAHPIDAVLGDVGFFKPGLPDQIVRRYNSGRFSPQRIGWGWMPAHPGMFLRRSIYDQVGRFRTDYQIAGDFEFVARAFGDGRLRTYHLPEILVKMQTGGVSTRSWRSTVLLNREIIRACRENGISTNALKLMVKFPLKALELLGL